MTGNDKSNGPGFLLEKELSLEELLEITAAGPSYDEAKARRAIMKIVAGAERFCDEVRRILLKPHDDWVAERHGLMQLIACNSNFLEEMGVGREALDKLAVYYTALEDQDHVAHPMFKVKNGDASVGSEIWRLRGMSAVALDYLVGAKEPLPVAAKRVARIPGFERLLSGRSKDLDPKTNEKHEPYKSVQRWRRTANRGEDLDETFRIVWAPRKPPGSMAPLEFRKEAARLIDKLRLEL